MPSPLILQAKHITKTYEMGEVEVRALVDVSLDIVEGEFIVLLGYSGSGKSTLLNILGGLDRPSSGELFYQGNRISDLSDRELTLYRREHIGFIFQMYNLIPSLSAIENVELVTEISTQPMSAHQALEMVGLRDRSEHFPSELSGGEQQRVAIARAIAKQPRLLFCDEPTGALDVKTGVKVLEAIQNVNQKMNTTTIVISHNQAIANMADRVITLRDGLVQDIRINSTRCTPDELEW